MVGSLLVESTCRLARLICHIWLLLLQPAVRETRLHYRVFILNGKCARHRGGIPLNRHHCHNDCLYFYSSCFGFEYRMGNRSPNYTLYIFSLSSRQNLLKVPSVKLYKNPLNWSRVFECGQTDRRTDGQTYDMVKLMVAFRNFSINRLHSASYSLRHLVFKHKVILDFTYLIETCCNICSSYFKPFFLYPYYCQKI